MLRRTPLRRRTGDTPAKRASRAAKRESVSAWKKRCDAAVSVEVRTRYADASGNVACYTCGKVAHWKKMQCGHFVSRNNSATRYDPDNLRVQCAGCNVWGRGRYDVFADKLMEELGVERFRSLLKRGRLVHQFNVPELKDIHGRAVDSAALAPPAGLLE